ncbi:hypothetical protein LLE49_25840 [Alicyclobacillus tolerans]|uniref:hypothetical protein n=1 Tax=Alicyclobacillus tolerans TaxID=90970 RepID=UPI001F21E240|nr:hypothetical protein [Alicyclobacillus tolerans]MCF8568151.1 hypothetical protein [Alicyclobacillus tolerans]
MPTAVLLDSQWPRHDEAQRLFERNAIPVTFFSGHFNEADEWLQEHSQSVLESPLHEDDGGGTSEAIQEPAIRPLGEASSEVRENPFVRKRPVRLTPGLRETVESRPLKNPVHESVVPVAEKERVVERIIEIPVEKPIYVREEIPTALAPVFVTVVGLWRRAGASLLSLIVTKWLSQHLPPNSVTLIEDPRQPPRLFDYFAFEEPYTHWLEDGRGTPVSRDGVQFVPMKPGLSVQVDEERFAEYIYRQLKRPFTILDAGQHLEPSLIHELADHILVVLDCDPTLLNVVGMAESYHQFRTLYEGKVHVILNKWTKHVKLVDPEAQEDLFPNAIKVPYLTPDVVQQALWKGTFLGEEVHEELSMLYSKLLSRWVPVDKNQSASKTHKSFFGRFRK